MEQSSHVRSERSADDERQLKNSSTLIVLLSTLYYRGLWERRVTDNKSDIAHVPKKPLSKGMRCFSGYITFHLARISPRVSGKRRSKALYVLLTRDPQRVALSMLQQTELFRNEKDHRSPVFSVSFGPFPATRGTHVVSALELLQIDR